MKSKIMFITCLVMTSLANCQQPPYSPLLNEVENFDSADLKTMMEMDPKRASLFFFRLTYDYNLRLPEAKPYQRALAYELFKHPQLEKTFIKLLEETPRHYDTAEKINWIWGPLLHMRYSWAIRLLGDELMDDTPVTQPGFTEEEIQLKYIRKQWTNGKYSFQTKSVYTLAHLKLPHAPFDENSPQIHNISSNAIDEWKTWYVEHGEEVIAQLKAEEAERAEHEAQAIAAAQAKTERYQNRPLHPPRPTSISKPNEKATEPPSSREIFISLILLTLSLIVLLTVHLRRSKTT